MDRGVTVSLLHIPGIVTAPAAMESTTHMLAHGLDLYYTRVAPAASFDGLAADFPFALLVRPVVDDGTC